MKLVTENLKSHSAAQFVESFSESSNTIYYMYAAKTLAFDDDTTPPSPNNTIQGTHYDIFDEMLFGKRIANNDVMHMARRVNWQANTIYIPYTHTSANLATQNFFVVSQEGANYYIFKCLDNNNGAYANDQPLFSETSAEDEYYQTLDGYVWKYMSTISASNWAKFATADYIPVIEDVNVTANAVSGAIETIVINTNGQNYNAYANGLISEASVGGNNLLFTLESSTSTLSSNTDFYKNSVLYIRSGTGAGQAKVISEYIVSGSVRRVLLASAFTTLPDITSVFEIGPQIAISGDGTGAQFVATVDTSANSISTIEVISRGSGYTYGTITISSNTGSSSVIVDANVTPIISPPGGHGSDVINELFANKVCLSTSFANNESNTIPTSNDYRKIGIIKDPLFANVELTLTTSDAGSFQDGETIIHYVPQSSNTVLRTFSYTLWRYQTLGITSNTGFEAGDTVSFEDKSGEVLTSNGTHINIRLGTSSALFAGADKIGDGSITRTIATISAANPAVVVTANNHGLANATGIIFSSITGTALDDTANTTYYAKVVNATAFSVYTDSGLSTTFDNSANTSATDGYVSTGTVVATVGTAAATFTGNNDPITSYDDRENRFGMIGANLDLPLSMRVFYNGTETSFTNDETSFTLTNITLANTDVITAEVYTTAETILTADYIGRTTAEVSNRSGTILRLRNINGDFSSGYQIKGLTSGTIATISTIDRSFNTFNQLLKTTVQITNTGTGGGIGKSGFFYDDYVTQSSSNASARVFAVSNTITRFISSVTAASPAVVTTSATHGFSNTQSITFENLNGTALTEIDTYYVKTVNTTVFSVYTDDALTIPFDNSAGGVANNGTVTSDGTGGNGLNSYKTFYLSDVKGTFDVSDGSTINSFTANNGAVAKIISKVEPDLVDNSGNILYVETLTPIERANDQTEKIKLILEF